MSYADRSNDYVKLHNAFYTWLKRVTASNMLPKLNVSETINSKRFLVDEVKLLFLLNLY